MSKTKVIHLLTKIQVVFCVPDEDGNAGQQYPITLDMSKLDENSWRQAWELIQSERLKLEPISGPVSFTGDEKRVNGVVEEDT